MKMLKIATAFLLVFCILTATAVCSAVVYDASVENVENPDFGIAAVPKSDFDTAELSLQSFSPRLSAPSKENKYYYSDANLFYKYGWGMPNCTCYAWGRAYEILKSKPELCLYSAYLWYDYNKENKLYSYGKTPKLGAIACWVYTSGTSGHVAVVEKITSDTITLSNSAWGGSEFYLETTPIDDPSNGRDSWIFQGYIYIGDYQSAEEDKPDSSNTQTPTDTAGDKSYVYRITSDNGVNMRSGAGTRYSVIGGISCGETVTVTKIKTDSSYTWGYTSYNGKSGWFVTDFAELIYTNIPEQVKPGYTPPDDKIEADERVGIQGDADLDGTITIIDATLMQKILAKKYTPTQYQLALCDFDGDSHFSVMDATMVQRFLAKII